MSNDSEKRTELNLSELDAVSGGANGDDYVTLEEYFNCFQSLGFLPEAKRLEPQGKKVVVDYIMDVMTKHAPERISRYNKNYAQKVYGIM